MALPWRAPRKDEKSEEYLASEWVHIIIPRSAPYDAHGKHDPKTTHGAAAWIPPLAERKGKATSRLSRLRAR